MLRKDSGEPIQGMPLGKGNATSPYTVEETDNVVEFTEAGDVTTTDLRGITVVTSVLAGGRYALRSDIVTVSFDGTFNVG